MIGHAAGLRRLDGIIWTIIAVLAAIMLVAPVVSNFQLVGHSFLAAGGATTLSLAGFWLYETRRPDPRLASALGGIDVRLRAQRLLRRLLLAQHRHRVPASVRVERARLRHFRHLLSRFFRPRLQQ